MIRVGLITPSLFTGGGERWMLSLVDHTPGVEWVGCAVVGNADPSVEVSSEMAARMPLLTCRSDANPGRYDWVSHAEFPRRQDALLHLCSRCDVVIAWGVPMLRAWLPAGYEGRTVIVSHGCDDDWTREFVERAACVATDCVAVSQAALNPFGKLAGRAAVIPNGVDPERCRPSMDRAESRRLFGWSDSDVVIGYLGRFGGEKCPGDVAEAVAELRKRTGGGRYKCWYVGAGQVEGILRRGATSLLGDAVRFTAPMRNVGDFLNAMDCLVSTSPSEGFGLSIVEGWLAGVPTVTTPTGIVPEAHLAHGRLSVTVPAFSEPFVVADAIERALRPENREVIERAHLVASECYTAGLMGKRWSDFLQNITVSNGGGGHDRIGEI